MDVDEVAQPALEREHHEMHAFTGTDVRMNAHESFMSTMSTTSCTITYTKSAKIYLFGLVLITCVPLVAGGAFTSIFIEDRNAHAAVSAFFATAISMGTLSLYIMHLFGKLEKYHDRTTLNGLKILGMIVSVASGILLGVYTILAFLRKQAFEFQGENYFSAAVFSGLWLGTSLELYIAAQWYQNALQKNAVLVTYQVPSISRAH